METSLNNNPENGNVSILNSIILNNYSIQNLFISQNNINSFDKCPKNPYNSFKNTFLSTPKNSKKRKIIIQPSTIQYKYTTPIPSNNTSSRFIHLQKINNLNKQPKEIVPKIIPIFKVLEIKRKEKHPKD